MITEEQYVLELFQKSFRRFSDRRIVLYGTGVYTEVILNNVSDYNFVGIMDGYKTSGSFLGYDILDYDSVLDKKAEIIIIIARSSNTKVIYNRISDFCKANNIAVMDIYGNNLIENENVFVENNEYFSRNEDELKRLIDENDAISFDIFDTLIMRYTLYPEDVLEIISRRIGGNDFVKNRKESDRQVNANIYEIYDEYKRITGISDSKKQKLINLEIEVEKSFLTAREKMVEILNYAVGNGKTVYLISDMYLPKDILGKILEKLGIKGYRDIFVSCDYKCQKASGLYRVYKNAVKGKKYLHIGDNYEADGVCAELNGISTYIIKNAYDMLDISIYRKINTIKNSLSERILLGIFIAKAFNNPFCLYSSSGRLKINSVYDRGYLFIAPLITSFMIWLINNVKNSAFDTILFSARDSFLVFNLYDKTREILDIKMPKGLYFLTSRMASGITCSTDEEDLRYFATYSYQGKPSEMLKKRFFLNDEDILEYNDNENVVEYVLRHKEKIKEVANSLRENYLKYIEKLGVKKNDNLAFIDFVSSGTSHYNLDKILGKANMGFYFIHIISTYEKKSKLNVKSLYEAGNMFEIKNSLFENYLFLEYIMSSLKPSLCCFGNNGEPIYLDERRTDSELETVKIIQRGIEDYYDLYLTKFSGLDEISVDFADIFLSFMDKRYSDIVDELSKNIVLENEFSNKDFLLKN